MHEFKKVGALAVLFTVLAVIGNLALLAGAVWLVVWLLRALRVIPS